MNWGCSQNWPFALFSAYILTCTTLGSHQGEKIFEKVEDIFYLFYFYFFVVSFNKTSCWSMYECYIDAASDCFGV